MAVDADGNEITQTTQQPVTPQEPSRAEERITQLSDKVKAEAEARAKAEADAKDAELRATFAEGFADVVVMNPAAKDHKDEIKEKVLKGYSVQDATFAVLGAAGKLGGTQSQTVQVAGGSAATAMPQTGVKEPKDMTQAERRAELEKVLIWQ